jgi:hypothetical protein
LSQPNLLLFPLLLLLLIFLIYIHFILFHNFSKMSSTPSITEMAEDALLYDGEQSETDSIMSFDLLDELTNLELNDFAVTNPPTTGINNQETIIITPAVNSADLVNMEVDLGIIIAESQPKDIDEHTPETEKVPLASTSENARDPMFIPSEIPRAPRDAPIFKVPRDPKATKDTTPKPILKSVIITPPQKPKSNQNIRITGAEKVNSTFPPLMSIRLGTSSNTMLSGANLTPVGPRRTTVQLKRLNSPLSKKKTDVYRQFFPDGHNKPICYKCNSPGHVAKFCPPQSNINSCRVCKKPCSDHEICDRCRYPYP